MYKEGNWKLGFIMTRLNGDALNTSSPVIKNISSECIFTKVSSSSGSILLYCRCRICRFMCTSQVFLEFHAFFVHINLPLFFNSSKSLIKTIPLHTRSIDCNEPPFFISLMIRSTFDSEVIFIFYASNQWRWPLCPHFKIASHTSQLRINSPCSVLRTNRSCSVVHSYIAFAA